MEKNIPGARPVHPPLGEGPQEDTLWPSRPKLHLASESKQAGKADPAKRPPEQQARCPRPGMTQDITEAAHHTETRWSPAPRLELRQALAAVGPG